MSQMSRESHHSPGFNPEAKEPAAAAAQLGGTLDLVDNILYLKIPNFEFLNTIFAPKIKSICQYVFLFHHVLL